MRFDYPLIKSEDYGHNSPQTASLKRVGFMLDVAIPGRELNPISDLEFNERYMHHYRMLSEKDKDRLAEQSRIVLEKFRSIYMKGGDNEDE